MAKDRPIQGARSTSFPTQRAIADYLDRETAEIDGMRADLDEMERLLEERRVSIIQRHVLPENGTYTRIKLVADVSLGKTVQKTQRTRQRYYATMCVLRIFSLMAA